MNFNNLIYIFSFFNGIRNRKITEGKQFFIRNYSGLSWHLRERRYLLMTRKGPVEYVFNLKHYLICFSVFIFGLCSSLSILASFITNVVKEDLVSSAVATPIIVADFIDYRALDVKYKVEDKIKKSNKFQVALNKKNYGKYFDSKIIESNILNELTKNILIKQTNKENLEKNYSSNLIFLTDSIHPNITDFNLQNALISKIETIQYNDEKKHVVEKDEKAGNVFDFISWLNLKNYEKNNNSLVIKDVLKIEELEENSLTNLNLRDKSNANLSINPSKMPLEAEAYRILSGFDNEIIQFKDLLSILSIDIGKTLSERVDNILRKRDIVSPDSLMFFSQLSDRVSLTKDLRIALNYVPLKAPMDYYYVSSKYGYRKDPITKKKRFHPGIDLAGTWHEDVLAPADGTVIFAGNNGGYGKMVKIKHRYGITTRYGHLQKVLVKKGQKVQIRDRIGKMGNTGRSTGQHLHYEILVNNKHIDPAIYIKEGKKLLTRNILQASN
ncbi:MAG: hypothetical protein CMN37_04815 [SAR116 cluster bacterium]|nr:hypothetical protein [SAR116 cluster bacterium]